MTLAARFVVLGSLAAAGATPASGASVAQPPKGGDYRSTLPNLFGACAAAFDGAELLVCTPESQDARAQLMRVGALSSDSPSVTAVAVPAASASDVAVAADGLIAVADLAGSVWIGRDAWKAIGAGALVRPTGVAWIGEALAVSDAGTGEVVMLSRAGEVTARIGKGSLGDPRGLAAAADGTLFVADRINDCLWRFDRAAGGSYAAAPRRLGEPGFNPGQLSAPDDVAVVERDGSRALVVADELNHRVHVLSFDGVFVGFFGMHALIPRMGEGRIHYPRSVAIAADGVTLAVSEAFEDRVQLFGLKPDADPIDATANRLEFISSHFGSDAACAADLLAVHDVETEAIALCDARTTPPIHMSIIGGGGALPQRFGEVSALAVEPSTGRVWIADRAKRRLDVFDVAWDRTKDPIVDLFLPKLARSMDLARLVRGTALRAPDITDILLAKRDSVVEALLLDRANRGIHRADARLTPAAREPWIALPPEARTPEELAVGADGRIAVADPVARRVFVRGADGAWTSLERLGDIAFVRPTGVEFGDDGRLVVSDAARDAVIVETAAGARLVGERGGLDEQFFDPESILPSPKGLIVIDRGNHRFQRFGGGFTWNLTGSLGRYYDQKRKGSPGAAPASTPEAPGASSRKGGAK